ncbi:hypothetical protein I6A60_35685 [Frankia sp. AgB1.9]|uniref:hypothetical protein n=1 Tax=unclassified Frankia TaxID=2632575 RepID=UPI001931EBBB|nr:MULTISPECIES: hypothetical protein [unclassified Frankia]MBL7489979.1 hypothetical protein [Frankia sp. AgW1.1]MBL7553155.1 hypothetical protein [Frankia sp. AgB1.9]MBL7622202.1 hypothetical protein [Frankia sp. AgB1.8]
MRQHATILTSPSERRRPRRTGPAAAALIAMALLAVSCGDSGSTSPGVASAGSRTASPSAGATKASALAYSQCMRAHGLADFPDPGSDGEIQLDIGPGSDLDQKNPKFQAADGACKSLLPGHGVPPTGAKAANLQYAKCMRTHGISDFPDPAADGTLQLQAQPGGDLDPNDPRFTAANEACQQYLLGGGQGGGLSTHGATS